MNNNHDLRKNLIDKIIIIGSIGGIPTIIVFIIRGLSTGWSFAYIAQTLVFIILPITALFRKRILFKYKVAILLICYFLFGSSAFWSFGLFGLGALFFASACFLSTVIWDKKAGLITLVITELITIFIGSLYILQVLELDFDTQIFNSSIASWLNRIITPAILIYVNILTIEAFSKELHLKIEELKNQKGALQKKLEENEILMKSMVDRELRMKELKQMIKTD